VFTNQEEVRATGIELELERNFANGSRLRASWSLQDTRNVTLDTELANSPEFLGKLLLDLPLGRDDLRLALEAQATGARQTLSGNETDPFVLVHASLTALELAEGVELALGVRNVFGTAYSDPVGSELVQDALLQDGRTFRVRLSISR
jgi:iron complex outermembrane receptor protein